VKDSPLYEAVRDQRFNEILGLIRRAVHLGQPITIDPKEVDYIRRTFHKGLLLGERRLHELAQRLLQVFGTDGKTKTAFVVWGRCSKPTHAELLKETVVISRPETELYQQPDSKFSDEHAPVCPRCGLKTAGILSFVQYKPEPTPESGLVLLSTRIKTTSNLCYKVADMVFDIDRMFQHDKIHGQFSQIVTDVYGVKLIFRNENQIVDALKKIHQSSEFSTLDEKDYLGLRKKKSGFEVYKLITKWKEQLFEIQVQSRAMYEREETNLPASHRTYKEKQMADRRKLGKEYLELYRVLTQLLAPPEQNFCEINYIELGFTKKGMDDEF
jgi:hypothetical protein